MTGLSVGREQRSPEVRRRRIVSSRSRLSGLATLAWFCAWVALFLHAGGAAEARWPLVWPEGERVHPLSATRAAYPPPVSVVSRRLETSGQAPKVTHATAVGPGAEMRREADRETMTAPLTHESVAERERAVEHAARCRCDSAVPLLAAALFDVDANVRELSVLALGGVGTSFAWGALAPAVGDPSKDVRLALLDALQDSDTAPLGLLHQLLLDDSVDVREAALAQLTRASG